ncbi:peptidyl-prolyl cis-trans isomerase Cyp18 [Acinetobacter baumannii ZW85-1]|nr:peptidyl-prolyl cis-trans isomerase Cyp18 [Acinetobacter baumannii ZW85-1]
MSVFGKVVKGMDVVDRIVLGSYIKLWHASKRTKTAYKNSRYKD